MTDFQNPVSALQSIMQSAQAATATGPVMGHQSEHFWQAQDRTLTELEKFYTAWFKRRHSAAQTALETSREIAAQAANDPATAMTLITEWQSQSMKRVTEDAQAFTEMMTNCIGSLVQNEVKAVEETVETTKRAMKQSASKPV